MYTAGRALQFLGLIVTGYGFFVGVLAGNLRRELALLAVGATIFFGGRFFESRGRGR